MADNAQPTVSRITYQSAYFGQHWCPCCEEPSFGTHVGEDLSFSTLVQVAYWHAGLNLNKSSELVAS